MTRILATALLCGSFLAGCPAPPEPGGGPGPSPDAPPQGGPQGGPPGGPDAPPTGGPVAGEEPAADGPPAGDAPVLKEGDLGFVPNAGEGGDRTPLGELAAWDVAAPRNTQDDIKAAGHYLVSGEVLGNCPGTLFIDVIEENDGPPPDGPSPDGPGEAQGPVGPLASLQLDGVGAYEVAVPKGKNVSLNALCDVDKDNKIDPKADKVSNASPPLSKATKDLKLVLM